MTIDLTFLATVLAMIVSVLSIVGFGSRWLLAKIDDRLDKITSAQAVNDAAHKGEHDVLNAKIEDIRHDLKNTMTKTTALEKNDHDKDLRIIKLETEYTAIRDSQGRIETAVKESKEEIKSELREWTTAMQASIREVRKVEPKA